MKYRGWEIDLTLDNYQGRFEASDPNGDYSTKFSDSVDSLIEEIDDEEDG
jgi:hypothetical protein